MLRLLGCRGCILVLVFAYGLYGTSMTNYARVAGSRS